MESPGKAQRRLLSLFRLLGLQVIIRIMIIKLLWYERLERLGMRIIRLFMEHWRMRARSGKCLNQRAC